MKKFFIILVILILSLILYSRFINTNNFKIVENTISIPNLPNSFEGFKIVQFSDLLYGSTKNMNDLEKIVNSINELKPDIIVFTGDLISKNYDITDNEINEIKKYLNNLECTLYKYAIIGDNDLSIIDIYKEIINDSDFILLDDTSTYIFYQDNTPIKLTGLTNSNNIENTLSTTDNLDTFYNIVLTHYSDYIDTIANYNVDLVLAGHSLLGQIRIPFFGGVIKKDNATKYLDSYYMVNNTKIFVSAGLGTDNNFKFRLFNKPTINLYRLNKES